MINEIANISYSSYHIYAWVSFNVLYIIFIYIIVDILVIIKKNCISIDELNKLINEMN